MLYTGTVTKKASNLQPPPYTKQWVNRILHKNLATPAMVGTVALIAAAGKMSHTSRNLERKNGGPEYRPNLRTHKFEY